jgi:hypothetical protein
MLQLAEHPGNHVQGGEMQAESLHHTSSFASCKGTGLKEFRGIQMGAADINIRRVVE